MGKGSKTRKGANFKAYWESELWENIKKEKKDALRKTDFGEDK